MRKRLEGRKDRRQIRKRGSLVGEQTIGLEQKDDG